jgi:hypothetical protein
MSVMSDFASEMDDVFFDTDELAECMAVGINDGTGHEKTLMLGVIWQGDLLRDVLGVAHTAALGEYEAALTVNAADLPRKPTNNETIKVNGKKYRIAKVVFGPMDMFYVIYLSAYSTN